MKLKIILVLATLAMSVNLTAWSRNVCRGYGGRVARADCQSARPIGRYTYGGLSKSSWHRGYTATVGRGYFRGYWGYNRPWYGRGWYGNPWYWRGYAYPWWYYGYYPNYYYWY